MGLADLDRFLTQGPEPAGGGLAALESFLEATPPAAPRPPTPPPILPVSGFEEFEPGPLLPSPTSTAGQAIQPVVQAVAPLARVPVEAARRTLEIEPAVRAGLQEATGFQRGEPIERALARRFMGLLRAASGFFEPLRSESFGQEIVAPAAEVLGAERLRPGIEAARERLGTGPLGRRVSEAIGEVAAEAPAITLPAIAQARAFARPPRPPAVVRPAPRPVEPSLARPPVAEPTRVEPILEGVPRETGPARPITQAEPPTMPQVPRTPVAATPPPRPVPEAPPPARLPAEAPVPAAPEPRAAGFQAGRAHRVITERGTEVDTQFALAEAGDLIPSHDTSLRPNPRFPSSLQPRARERVASEIQLQRFEEGLIPSTLGESPKASKGAPIIGPDRVVESGNLRTIALQRLYERNHPNAQRYREYLLRNAEEFGLDPRQIERMERPVLVQVRRTQVDRVRFAQEANEGTAAAMSATEQARQDANRMSERLVNLLEPSESGELLTAGNRDFFREFAGEVVPPRELGRFLDARGNISTEGVARVRNALFARVFDDPTAVARLAESADVNIRNIQNGILQALPRLARIKQGIQAGSLHDLDLAPAITEAANALSSARATGLAPQNVLRQASLFGEELSPAGRLVFQHFLEKSRSARAIGETLKNYADLVENQGAPAQAGLFGGRVPTVEELFQAAAGGRQAGLFEGAPPGPPSAGMPAAARVSAEAGRAPSISAPSPPGTQPVPSQVSIRPEPSGMVTPRRITPPETTGPITTTAPSAMWTSGKRVIQPANEVNRLLQMAAESKGAFDATLQELVGEVPGLRLFGTRVKQAHRVQEKVALGRAPNTVSDYLGARVWVDGPEGFDAALEGLRSRFEVLHVDDFRRAPRTGGYRAVHAQVRLPNGLSAEVQLVPRNIGEIQEQWHRRFLEKWRNKREFAPDEWTEYQADRAEATAAYDEAYRRFEAGRAAPAEPVPPARAPEAGAPTRPPPPPEETRLLGQSLPGAQAGRFARPAEQVGGSIQQTLDQLDDLSRRARIALEQEPEIARRGTLAPEAREAFREGEPKPETFTTRISEEDVRRMTATLVKTTRDWKRLRQQVLDFGDTLAVNSAEAADRLLENVVQEWTKLRFAAGRTVKAFDIPPDMRHALQEAGVLVGRLRTGQVRLPLYTSIISKLRRVKGLTSGEWRTLGRELVDAWRLNLFSVTSWTLDLVGNLAEVSAQLAGGAARDFYSLGKGQLNFPSLQGWVRAVRERARMRGQPLPVEIEERFGRTIGGERIGGTFRGALTGAEPGTFTTRTTAGSRAVDLIVGSPLYAKGAFDTAAKRLAGTASVWRDAIEEANRLKLRGLARRQFYGRYMRNLPEEAIERAVAAGNKAGFNRELTRWEERLAGSTTFRILGDVFARWPFQFTRTMGEWLGANPQLFRRIANGTIKGEEIAEYVGKTATGWGGLWLIEEGLYDRVDFNSMEYVHENGERTRLSNRDPIPTALWFLATIKGDQDRSTAALRYASLPFARLLVGEGGLLGGIVNTFVRASRNRPLDARSLHRELTDMVNRAIPGQALLSAVKSVFDPVLREGVGAQLPGVSLALPARVEPTTGEPLVPRQRIPGLPFEVPAIGGTPIPGARRVTEPVFNLLSRYGLLVYRGPRQPIAGLPAAEVPEDLRREWEEAFGKHRQRLLRPLAHRLDQLERGDPERVREMIQRRDAAAAKLATQEVNARAGAARRRLPRQPTARERRGPAAFKEVR